MSEKRSYVVFRENVVQPGDRIDRIENLVGVGFPDTNGCFNGIEFWMEIKSPTEPRRDSTPLFGSNHRLSLEQRNWFLRQRRAKGLGFVYIDTNKRRMLIDGCRYAEEINLLTADELAQISVWLAPKPTSKGAWNDFRQFIANHG
jgi:hypothetical protein